MVAAPPDTLPGALAPQIALAREGVLLTWIEPTAEGHRLRFSRVIGDAWSEPVTIASGPGFFANWADVPSVAEGEGGDLLAHWLAKNGEGTYAYGIQLARSIDGGATWQSLGPLEDDTSPTEHGFVSLLAAPGGGFRAVWLDGRETAHGGPMTLRSARVAERPGPSEVLDARVCDCCPTAAARTSGGFLVAYRDRTEEEVRDVHVLRRGPGGWSAPQPIQRDGWVFPACPVNGPAVAAAGDRAVVAWFTAAGDDPRVLAAFSEDGGASFGAPVKIAGEGVLGRVSAALAGSGEEAVVSWLASEEGEGVVYLRRVARGGALGEPVRLAATTASRGSGVPRVLARGETLYAVWTEAGEKGGGEPSRLRFRSLPVDSLPAPGNRPPHP